MFIWNKIIVFLLSMLIIYLMCILFKTNKEGIQYEIEQNYIATKDIPRLTRTIHCCDNLENLKCVNGDLIELKKDGSDIYFVYSNYEFHRLTIAQVLELENKYSMRIMF